MNTKKRILILGKSGLLAQAAIRIADKKNYEVSTLSRSEGFDLSRADAGRILEESFKRIGPSLIFNAAGMTDLEMCEQNPNQAWLLNARLPALIARLANQAQCPWVHTSTDHYFTGNLNLLHTEYETPKPPNEYALSKLAGEEIALASSKALVIRTNIIGKRGWVDQPNFAEWVMKCLHEQIPFNVYTDTWASSIEVGQFSNLALELAGSGATGLVNLASSESISKSDLIERIAIQSGFSTKYLTRIKTPNSVLGKLRRANSMGLDCTKAEQLLSKLGLSLPNADEVVSALVKSFGSEK
jgi:dTDP-4-dehydrorhamnose reductase